MAENKRQQVSQMRITDEEFEMLKDTFADRDEFLKTIRNLFLGLEISEDEKKQITDLFGKNVKLRKLMRKQFLPEIQGDLPIGQAIDLWMTIDLKDKDIFQIQQVVGARRKLIDMIEIALKLLKDIDGDVVNLEAWEKLPWVEGTDTALIARNTFISHIDQQLQTIKVLAGMKKETVDETKNRLLQNSSK